MRLRNSGDAHGSRCTSPAPPPPLVCNCMLCWMPWLTSGEKWRPGRQIDGKYHSLLGQHRGLWRSVFRGPEACRLLVLLPFFLVLGQGE